jgi:hypothetical protein
MNCFCCGREVAIARKVKIRRWCSFDEWRGGPESAAYKAYEEQMTHRWGIVCPGCYMTLDNSSGAAQIAGSFFNLAGASRDDRARTITLAQYLDWQRKEAEKLGVGDQRNDSAG